MQQDNIIRLLLYTISTPKQLDQVEKKCTVNVLFFVKIRFWALLDL